MKKTIKKIIETTQRSIQEQGIVIAPDPHKRGTGYLRKKNQRQALPERKPGQ